MDCIADLAARDYWTHWQTIRCPTLIVRGERGNFSSKHVQRAADAIPGAQIATIPDSGHDVHLDNPRELIPTLQQFLQLRGPG